MEAPRLAGAASPDSPGSARAVAPSSAGMSFFSFPAVGMPALPEPAEAGPTGANRPDRAQWPASCFWRSRAENSPELYVFAAWLPEEQARPRAGRKAGVQRLGRAGVMRGLSVPNSHGLRPPVRFR